MPASPWTYACVNLWTSSARPSTAGEPSNKSVAAGESCSCRTHIIMSRHLPTSLLNFPSVKRWSCYLVSITPPSILQTPLPPVIIIITQSTKLAARRKTREDQTFAAKQHYMYLDACFQDCNLGEGQRRENPSSFKNTHYVADLSICLLPLHIKNDLHDDGCQARMGSSY